MVSITKVVGVLSCGFLLCLGLSNGANANTTPLAEDDMNASQSEREGGQAGLKGDQDKLRGLKSSRTIKGEVVSVEGDGIYLQKQDGTAVRVHTDQTTKKTGNIYPGARVEAEVNNEGHARSIRSAGSTDRRNEADRKG